MRPTQAVASGKVAVDATVPVNTIVLSVLPMLVDAPEYERKLRDKAPLTSNVELGVVVPTPTCADAETIIKKVAERNKISVFITRDWIFLGLVLLFKLLVF